MDKESLKNFFKYLKGDKSVNWAIHVLKIDDAQNDKVNYVCSEIRIHPDNEIKDYIAELSQIYEEKMESYASVEDFVGDFVNNAVYRLQSIDAIIEEQYYQLELAISNSNIETSIERENCNALAIRGIINNEDSNEWAEKEIMFVFKQTPFTELKRRYRLTGSNEFVVLEEPLLSLRKNVDVLIIGNEVFLFSLKAEKIFGLEQKYKEHSIKRIEEIANSGFISNVNFFRQNAKKGHNPRRFVDYNIAHFEALKDVESRRELATVFGLSMVDNKIEIQTSEDVDKLIKLICNKAMLDPCDKTPKEVAAAKKWNNERSK